MKALHFGAGNIGRGFIGLLLKQNGYDLTFADVNKELIDLLKEHRSYHVIIADESHEKILVEGFDALNSVDETQKLTQLITEVDLITMAVGPRIIPHIAKSCLEGIKQRLGQEQSQPLNIIACENAVGATDLFKEELFKNLTDEEQAFANQFIGFPNSAVDRIVPAQNNENPLDVKVEPFFEWAIERSKIKGNHVEMNDVHYVEDLKPYIERKLFTVNTGHASTAYYGLFKGYETVSEALQDSEVEQFVRDVLSETSQYVLLNYDFDEKDHADYVNLIINRFKNPEISDKLLRVGRGPLRKLSKNDRFVKPALGLLEHGITPHYLSQAMAYALVFNDDQDPESVTLQDYQKEHTVAETLENFSELDPSSPLINLVKEESEKMNVRD